MHRRAAELLEGDAPERGGAHALMTAGFTVQIHTWTDARDPLRAENHAAILRFSYRLGALDMSTRDRALGEHDHGRQG